MIEATASTSAGNRRRGPIDRDQLRLDADGRFTCFGDYMHAKIRKLIHQVHDNDGDGSAKKSSLFAGLSFYINGYTNPPALELRHLIVRNGGQYHHYYAYGHTTYTLATALSISKWRTLRVDEKVLRPEWITQCINVGHLLPDEPFILRRPDVSANTAGRAAVAVSSGPSAISDFYQRSRLHLISTLAQELKTFVVELRHNGGENRPSESAYQQLIHLSHPVNEDRENETSSRTAGRPIICHIDMDCFFVAVALRNRPDLRGRPVAVTHSKATAGGYGEIASCSYEARACGVRSSMLVHRALELCPMLVCLPYESFDVYREMAKRLYTTVASYTLHIRAVSCDELYVNLTSLCVQMCIDDVGAVVEAIRADIFDATQCQASVGIGSNALLARLATRSAKPNGQFWVKDTNLTDFMSSVALRDLPGVGYAMENRLREAFAEDQLADCRCLQRIPLARLQAVCGEKSGLKIYESCRGLSNDTLDVDQLDETTTRKSVSCDVNFGVRLSTKEDLWRFLDDVAGQLAAKLEVLRTGGSALTLKLMIRAPDAPLEPKKYGAHGPCTNVSRTFVYAQPAGSAAAVASAAKRLAVQLAPVITDIRGIGLQMTRLTVEVGDRPKRVGNGRVSADAGQPSITSFLRVRKTPSPIVCLELGDSDDDKETATKKASSPKVKESAAPEKMTKKTAQPPKKKSWSMFAVPKQVAKSRRTGRPPAAAAPTIKTATGQVTASLPPKKKVKAQPSQNAQSRSLARTELRIIDRRLHIDDIAIDFTEAPSQSTFERLNRLLMDLLSDLNVYKVKNFYGFLSRGTTLTLADAGWALVTQTLRQQLNTAAVKMYGTAVID